MSGCCPLVCTLLLGFCVSTLASEGTSGSNSSHPNVVILLIDDLGIGDVGCYGNDTIRTPSIDRLAGEGVLLSHHVAGAPFCTPSRASLLTARYAQRFGLVGEFRTPPVIVHVASRVGIPLEEPTIGHAFEAAGYTTHFTGKWHLGSRCGLFGRNCTGPLDYGFDSTLWLPTTLLPRSYGNYTFWVLEEETLFFHATGWTSLLTLITVAVLVHMRLPRLAVVLCLLTAACLLLVWFILAHYRFYTPAWHQVSPWMDHYLNGVVMNRSEVVDQPMQLHTLNERLTNNTVHFIRSHHNASKPFLVVHSFGHVHTPIVTAPENRGRSKHGRYGDSIEEMDDSVGEILNTLDELGLANNCVVYLVSDHGGHLESLGEDGQRTGGYNGLFKGSKGQGGMEGALRVPGIVRYPGIVPKGSRLDTPTSLLDTLPTLLQLAGLPALHKLLPHNSRAEDVDGLSYAPLLMEVGKGVAPQPMLEGRMLLHHSGLFVDAVRYITGEHVYKLHLRQPVFSPGSYQCGWGEMTFCRPWFGGEHVHDMTQHPLLYDLTTDPYEDNPIDNSTSEYQQVEERIQRYLKEWEERVPYPSSQFNVKMDTMLLPWLQPFKKGWFF